MEIYHDSIQLIIKQFYSTILNPYIHTSPVETMYKPSRLRRSM